MEATIVSIQRTMESLQAEFVAMREKQDDKAMQHTVSGVVLELKRPSA